MKINELEKLQNEGVGAISLSTRRRFIELGFKVAGVFLGGSVLSLVPVKKAFGSLEKIGRIVSFPYEPHYTMVIRHDLCIDCEKCMEACVRTNNVPLYGYRTKILDREIKVDSSVTRLEFLPVQCNHCNRPPCVQACPTKATFKDKTNGLVLVDDSRCIGCRACITVCPYNARYMNQEISSADKCDFCYRARLIKGAFTTACVEECPTGARIFGDLNDPKSEVYQLVRAPGQVAWVLRPNAATIPNVFYIKD